MVEKIGIPIILEDGYEIKEYYSIDGEVRAIVKEGGISSAIFLDKDKQNDLCDAYYYFYNIPIYNNPKGTNYLVLGGGTFSYPRYLLSHFPNMKTTVVEIDKKMLDYSKKYFYFDDFINKYSINSDRLNIVFDDALNFIKKNTEAYDYILIDLFDGLKPFDDIYLEDNIKYLKKTLSNKGSIVINYLISKYNINDYKNIFNILKNNFTYFKVITTHSKFNKTQFFGNVIVILSNDASFKLKSKIEYEDFYIPFFT